jgi:ABC-type cobalamin/Fe3+-siderophores transport system ATPase subunit
VSYLPQNLNTPFAFHVAELLALGGTYDHRHPALDVMELQPLLGRSLISLSGGELQRATIARALIAPAPILLLDEPLAHLDLRHALRLLEYLRDRADDGQSVVLSLHGPLLRHARPGRVWLLKDGKLHFDGPVADLDDTTLAEVFALTKDNLLIFT